MLCVTTGCISGERRSDGTGDKGRDGGDRKEEKFVGNYRRASFGDGGDHLDFAKWEESVGIPEGKLSLLEVSRRLVLERDRGTFSIWQGPGTRGWKDTTQERHLAKTNGIQDGRKGLPATGRQDGPSHHLWATRSGGGIQGHIPHLDPRTGCEPQGRVVASLGCGGRRAPMLKSKQLFQKGSSRSEVSGRHEESEAWTSVATQRKRGRMKEWKVWQDTQWARSLIHSVGMRGAF